MKNGYSILSFLTTTLNNNSILIDDILEGGKEAFSKDDTKINIALGIVNEVKEMLSSIDPNIFILNIDLYKLVLPIKNYSLFNKYNLVNAYKLYDALKLDITNLKNILNEINGDQNV